MTSAQGNQSQATNSSAGTEWPKQVDFTQALQNPQVSLIGDSVKGYKLLQAGPGRPIMWSGSFAAVYKLENGGTFSVIRCFTKKVTDQKDRYTKLSDFLSSRRPQFLVRFEYLDEGVLVKGNPYPLVKMDFVEGENLNIFVGRIIENQQNHAGILSMAAERWMSINSTLRNFGIAHNDLQHGNVIVQDNYTLRLVDYDSFYLPESEGNSPEGGHGNYQHPLRKRADYNEHIDNFPALVIYLSLLALDSEPNLWRFSGDQNILFTKRDFDDPASSDCFRELKGSRDDRIRSLTNYLEQYCSVPVEAVPNLDSITAAENAGQIDAPLTQGASTVQSSQPSAAQSASPVAAPTGPTAGQGGPPQAPAGQVQPPQSGRVNPASVAGRRSRMQTPIPTAQQSPATPAPAAAVQAVSIVKCSSGHINDIGLIYCQEEQCADTMQPGTQGCADCQYIHPANANFCPQCSRKLK